MGPPLLPARLWEPPPSAGCPSPGPPAPQHLPCAQPSAGTPRLNKSTFDGACDSDTVPFSHLETSIAASSFLPAAQEGASWRPAQRSPDPWQPEAGPVQAPRWRVCTGPWPGAPGVPSPLPQALALVPCRSRGLGIPPLPVSGLSRATPGQVPGGFPPPPSDITKADPLLLPSRLLRGRHRRLHSPSAGKGFDGQ